jgi:hypothetical protein
MLIRHFLYGEKKENENNNKMKQMKEEKKDEVTQTINLNKKMKKSEIIYDEETGLSFSLEKLNEFEKKKSKKKLRSLYEEKLSPRCLNIISYDSQDLNSNCESFETFWKKMKVMEEEIVKEMRIKENQEMLNNNLIKFSKRKTAKLHHSNGFFLFFVKEL